VEGLGEGISTLHGTCRTKVNLKMLCLSFRHLCFFRQPEMFVGPPRMFRAKNAYNFSVQYL
jgi:hypothetical protein